MRAFGAALAFATVVPAYTAALSNVSPNQSSGPALSSTGKPADACGIDVITITETAYSNAPKATTSIAKGDGYKVEATPVGKLAGSAKLVPSDSSSASPYEARPTGKIAKPFGQNKEYFRYDTEGDVELQPCNHWDFNTKDPKNLVPTGKTQLYYAEGGRNNAKPTNEFYFGVIDLFFKAPAVVLEHSSYINNAKYANNELKIDFSSAVACDFASESWKKGTIIVSTTAKCKVSSDDDQCYFKVDEVIRSDDGKSAIVKGRPQARDECTEGGEAHWGRYRPEKEKNATATNSTFPPLASSYSGFPTSAHSSVWPTAASKVSTTKSFGTDGLFTYSTSSTKPTETSDVHSGGSTISVASSSSSGMELSHSSAFPVPTSSMSLSSDIHSFLATSSQGTASQSTQSIAPSSTSLSEPEISEEGTKGFGDEPSVCKAPVDTKYNLPTACTGQFFDLDLDEFVGYGELSADDLAFLKEATAGLDTEALSGLSRRALMHRRAVERRLIKAAWGVFKKVVIQPAASALKTTVNVGGAILKGGAQLITTGSISGGIKESFNFNLPDGNAADVKQVDSPWGPAALIAAYGLDNKIQADKGVQREGYLNIFCVGCGAQGRVELAGRATWAVGRGITQGEIEAWADLKVAMKIGVDAQIKLTREWKKTLFQKGLPKLSFGPIIIGPSVKVESRATLEAGAEGRILAGAEMNWNRAYAKVDFINPDKSTRHNFDPVGHPTFEAEGSLYVGAELGLPIGMHFGITVSSWSKTVALINEPMIKGIAKAAVRAELADGKITAGFTPTEGCQGIHANLSWRNKLVCNILDLKEFTLLDSDYKSIKSMCIPLGKQTAPKPEDDTKTPDAENGGDKDGMEEGSSDQGQEPAAEEPPKAEPTDEEEKASTGETSQEESGKEFQPPSDQTPNEDSGTGAGQEGVENDSDAAAEADAKRSVHARQTGETQSTSSDAAPDGLRDVTESVKAGSQNVNYQLADIKTVPYVREDGYEFTKLLAGDYNVMYCSDGSMYVKQTTQTAALGCDELFAYSEDSVVGDGQGRYFYYHDDAMKAAGVSRLRLGDEEVPVKGTSAVAMTAWSAEKTETEYDAEIEGLYVVADYATEDLYWLSFCVFKDGQAPKVFVVADLNTGLGVLESVDVKYSITGGDVERCYPLLTKEDPALSNTWAEWDDSLDVDADGLEFDL